MKILVTGREGQVVTSLLERSRDLDGMQVVAVGRPDLDLSRPETVRASILAARPDIVVSAAAYTAVDKAEDEPDLAAAVNAVGAGAVAAAAAEAGIPVIHLSTDYVFAGDKDGPYLEEDVTGPTGAYGRSKLDGEAAVAAANPRHVILRTAWVYSPFGGNFVKTMLRLAADRDVLTVVADQHGNPTSALDIADAILAIAPAVQADDGRLSGIYHLAGTGETHWAGLAQHVLDVSRDNGGPWAQVREITSAEFPTKARRPFNSRLSTDRLDRTFGWRAPHWRDSSRHVVERLLAEAR